MDNFLKSLPDSFELNEFKLEKVLGQGGFGITYLALDMNLMQHVAIKEYFPREFANRDSTFTIHAVGNAEDKDTFAWGLKRFLDEARVLAQLSHPNIISIKRFFEANGTAYLVMEYCDGKPLDEVIRGHGPLNEHELNGILFPLLDGLEHVHEKAFLHRDIKPANIFIRRNGSPVLLDFGAAKHEMTSHSKSVTSLATAGYAPFEQYSTKGKQGTWSDIYGLAATIYRAISGIKPQDAPGRMLEDTLAPSAEILKGKFDPNLLMTLDKALAIRPEDRPQTIDEFRKLIKVSAVFTPPDEQPKVSVTDVQSIPKLPRVSSDSNLFEDKVTLDGYSENGRDKLDIHSNKQNLFFIFLVLALLFLGGWYFFTPNDSVISLKSSEVVRSEPQSSEKSIPLVLDKPSTVSDNKFNNSTIETESVDEKKVAPSSSPVLSFVEIDRAIETDQLGKAHILLKDAIRKNPDNAGVYFRMAQVLLKEEKYPEAREQLIKAKRIDPSLRFINPGKYQQLYNEILAMEKISRLPGRD